MGRPPGGVEQIGVDERSERLQRRLEVPVLVAALLVIPVIALEESHLGAPWDMLAGVLNWAIWLTFVAEVVAMLAVVPDRWEWLRRHPLDVPIVLFTPPFVPASMQAARVFRLARLLRLARGFVAIRVLFTPYGLRYAAVITAFLVLISGAAFAAVEKDQQLSAWDGMYWAITTVTTVGYGDISPTTDTGRVIAIAVMLTGIGFVAIVTGAVAERFMAASRELRRDERRLADEIAELRSRLDRLDR